MEFGCAAMAPTSQEADVGGRPTASTDYCLGPSRTNWKSPGLFPACTTQPAAIFWASTHRLLLHTVEAFSIRVSRQAKESTTRGRIWPFHTYETFLQPPSARVEVCRNVMVSAHSCPEKISLLHSRVVSCAETDGFGTPEPVLFQVINHRNGHTEGESSAEPKSFRILLPANRHCWS